MKAPACLPVVLLLCSGPPAALASPADMVATPPSPENDVSLIDVDPDLYQRMTVPVLIDGKGPFRFVVDTGSQATVVTPRVTDHLGLSPTGRATVVAMASAKPVDLYEIIGLQFAGRVIPVLSSPLLERQNVGADGIIGLDTLQDLRVVMDFRNDRISVAAPPLARNKDYEIVVVARRRLGQMIITNARIDGIKTAVIIDTGAWASIANPALSARLRRRLGETSKIVDVHGTELTGETFLARKLTLKGVTLENLPLSFADSPVFHSLGLSDKPAIIMGLGNLRPFERVAIDFSRGEVLFDLSDGTAAKIRPRPIPYGVI